MDTGEALMSRYNFAGEQHFFEKLRFPKQDGAQREGGAGGEGGRHYQKIRLGKNVPEIHL